MTQHQCPIAAWAATHPRSVAVEAVEDHYTYADLHHHVRRMMTLLREQGIQSGRLVAFTSHNHYASVVTLWALLRLRAIAFPISPRMPPLARHSLLESLHVHAVLDDPDAELRSALARPPHEDGIQTLEIDVPATAMLTSGSTLEPRAAIHTLAAHFASARGSATNIPLHPGHHWLWSLPLGHMSGLAIVMRTMLAGATLTIVDRGIENGGSPDTNRVTHMSLVATQLQRYLANPRLRPRSLEAVLLGGGPYSRRLVESALERGVPLHTSYGLTEMASQVTTTRAGSSVDLLMTAGSPLPGREIAITSAGEILVRGETLFLGFRRGDALELPVHSQGWYPTRDLGQFVGGLLTVHGRLDHMFVSGENIVPEEIEASLREFPEIVQAVVVPVDDAEFGNVPVAFVDAPAHDPVAWERWLRDRFPGFKVPKVFHPWPESDRGSIKPARRELRRKAQALQDSRHDPP